MKSKAPPSRRKFANAGDEIDYLYHKLLYWLYDRGDARRARPYADRLEKRLARLAPDDDGIRGEESRSLICEVRGDLPGAIRHRENEVRRIRRLHEVTTKTPSWDVVRQHYDYGDLSDRLDLLAILYRDSGELDRAIRTLQESKRLCDRYGIPFDSQDVLDDYLKEKKGRLDRRARPAS